MGEEDWLRLDAALRRLRFYQRLRLGALALFVLLLCTAWLAWGDTATHALPDQSRQRQVWAGDGIPSGFVVSGCLPTVPSASLTFSGFACQGYVKDTTTGERLWIGQASATVTLANTNGTHWVAVSRDTRTSHSGWSRRSGTHYLFRQSATRPTDATGVMLINRITVAVGVISAVEDFRRPSSWARFGRIDATDPLYGADSSGGTSASAALQAAVDASNAQQAGCVYLPGGRYMMTDTVQVVSSYSGTEYPNVLVKGVGLCGAGANATFVEWNGTWALQTTRKAVLYFGGNYAQLRDLTVSAPRAWGSLNAALASYKTPYYGIVVSPALGASWKLDITNVNVFFVHVPLSVGIIKTYIASGANGLEFEPAAGGAAFPAGDYAQFALTNVRLDARTYEFEDGTLNRAAQNNANGTNLNRGTAHTTDLTGAAVSDGSYAAEFGAVQTVGVTCRQCSFFHLNDGGNGTIRHHAAGQVHYDSLVCIAPPLAGTWTFCLFENIASGGSNVSMIAPYFSSGIYIGHSSQGSLSIRDGDGEFSSATTYLDEVALIVPLDGVNIGASIAVDGLEVGKGTGGVRSMKLSGATQGANPVAPFGNTAFATPTHRFRFRGLKSIGTLRFGHETLGSVGDMSRFNPQMNLLPNVTALLKNKAVNPLYLQPSQYDPWPAATAALFVTGEYLHGIWHRMATAGSANVLAPIAPINDATSYTACANVYVLMAGANTIADLSGEVTMTVAFLDASKVLTGTQVSMLGSLSVTQNYSLLTNAQTTRLCNYHLVPPTGAAYMAVYLASNPVGARTSKIGVGNLSIIPAPAEEVVESLDAPLWKSLAANTAPATGTWAVGDLVWNVTPSVGQPIGWLCTVAGTPGTWVALANL